MLENGNEQRDPQGGFRRSILDSATNLAQRAAVGRSRTKGCADSAVCDARPHAVLLKSTV
jgi:hypothetical protein